ncbi:MAG: EipA family protein [Alphaproteobacteria bacterium]|nr:EipA family protein [Alphaproteobacteria bacterium]
MAEDPLPWKAESPRGDYDVYREVEPRADGGGYVNDRDGPPSYVPPRVQYRDEGYGSGSAYNRGPDVEGERNRAAREREDYREEPLAQPPREERPDYSRHREPERRDYDRRADYDRGRAPRGDVGTPYYERGGGLPRDRVLREDYRETPQTPSTYSQDEILKAGHGFFGSVSQGLAEVVEKAFRDSGRPNGYILGEDAGGAFIAGLRYGEGTLFTRDAGRHKVYWQGPTIGYDFGAEGSKTMVLIYNLAYPGQIYQRFGGVQGSAYIVGGVGMQIMKRDDVTLAPIRSGVGLRLGANVGYLKYTRTPTWNPF